ncbi:hypothetical protein SNE35_28600 [Paucibacter sp. R3-3]|uniref:DUF3784 domain-containing protein n=1 Tax=Roseateles agri TaxID=3098619 RepID=A0ABU5DQV8_9BURK|nr:hypothetical protein [Paucibacter sp. R3-3]MDY0748494.1 hypothetical protein [Paucibacter sp. R3-3]
MIAASLLYTLGGLVVLAEALNKLERVNPLATSMAPRERCTETLKALAWVLLGLGAAGAVFTPLLGLEPPTWQDVFIVVGFAVLIVRTRVKEG